MEQRVEDAVLNRVGVLELVDERGLEPPGNPRREDLRARPAQRGVEGVEKIVEGLGVQRLLASGELAAHVLDGAAPEALDHERVEEGGEALDEALGSVEERVSGRRLVLVRSVHER